MCLVKRLLLLCLCEKGSESQSDLRAGKLATLRSEVLRENGVMCVSFRNPKSQCPNPICYSFFMLLSDVLCCTFKEHFAKGLGLYSW